MALAPAPPLPAAAPEAVAAFNAEQLQQQQSPLWPRLLVAAAIAALLLAGELRGAQDGSGAAQLRAAATATPSPMRVLELAMATAAQEHGAELFVIDCFRRPLAAPAAGRSIVCLFKGQGSFREAFADQKAVEWSCAVASESAVPALRAYSTPLIGALNRGTGDPYPVHVVECACAAQFDGQSVRVTVSAARISSSGGAREAAVAASSVLVAPPPPPLLAPQLRRPGGVFLAGSVCISDTFWDTASPLNVQLDGMVTAVTLSVLYHLAVGLEHMAIYLDLRAPEAFLAEFAVTLRPEVARGQVTFFRTHAARAHPELEFQEMLLNHALYWHKTQAAWLALFDVDEYFQPVLPTDSGEAHPGTLLRAYVARLDAARRSGSGAPSVRVRSQFWWGEKEDWTSDISSLQLRRAGDYLSEGTRTKCLFATDDVLAASVHVAVAPQPYEVAPLDVLRLNHFKFFGGNRIRDAPPELDPSFASLWAMLDLPWTGCASRARPRCDRTNATASWPGPPP